MQDCAHMGTSEAAEAQSGAAVIVVHEDDPPAERMVVAGISVGAVEATTAAAEFIQDCAHEGTSDIAGAQFRAAVIVVHEDDPPAGGLIAAGALVKDVEDVAGTPLDDRLVTLVEAFEGVTVPEDPPPPP